MIYTPMFWLFAIPAAVCSAGLAWLGKREFARADRIRAERSQPSMLVDKLSQSGLLRGGKKKALARAVNSRQRPNLRRRFLCLLRRR